MTDGDRIPVPVLRAGDIELDRSREEVRVKGKDTGLRGRNYEVLLLLMQRAPDLVTKDEILDTVWKDIPVTEGVLTTALKTIRSALGDSAQASACIETRYGRGYRFSLPVSAGNATAPEEDGLAANEAPRTGIIWPPSGPAAGAMALILTLALLAAFVPGLWPSAERPRFQVRVDPLLGELEAPLQAEMLSRGMLDASTRPRRFELDIRHSDQEGEAAIIALGIADAGEALDIRSIPLEGLSTSQLARRISLENANIVRCADLLSGEAQDLIDDPDRLFPEIVRLCRALLFSDSRHDPVMVSRRMLEQAEGSPFLMALHALVVATQPNRYLFGRPVSEAERIRSEAATLAAQAYDAMPESRFIRSAYILNNLGGMPTLEQFEALSRIPVESWAGFYATAQTVVLMRQAGRIQEARFLAQELDGRWPAVSDQVIGHAILAATANNWDESRTILKDYLSLYPDSVQVGRLMTILTAFYGSEAERNAAMAAPSLPERVRTCFDVPVSLTPDTARIERIINACNTLDVSIAARQMARIGGTSRALDILERFDPAGPGIAVTFYYPEFAAVRQTERFSAIAEAFGLLDYWRESGELPDFCYQQIDAPVCIQAVFE